MAFSDAEVILSSGDHIAVRKDSVTGRDFQKVVLCDKNGVPIEAEDLGGTTGNALFISAVGKQEVQGVMVEGADLASQQAVFVGGYAAISLASPTPLLDGKFISLKSTTDGRQLVLAGAPPGDTVFGSASNTDGTATTVIGAQIAAVRTYVTWVHLVNTSGTPVSVQILDGVTQMDVLYVKATDSAYVTYPTPLRGTAATAWNFDPSTAATTIFCSAGGYKSKA